MKKITGKQKKKSNSQQKAIKIKQGFTEKESKIANEVNKYSTRVGTGFVSKVNIHLDPIEGGGGGDKNLDFESLQPPPQKKTTKKLT